MKQSEIDMVKRAVDGLGPNAGKTFGRRAPSPPPPKRVIRERHPFDGMCNRCPDMARSAVRALIALFTRP